MSDLQLQPAEVEQIVLDFINQAAMEDDSLIDKRGKIFDAGLSRVEFPEGFGGRSWPRGLQKIVDKVLKEKAGIEPLGMGDSPIGIGMAAPTVLAHGHDDVKQRLLRERTLHPHTNTGLTSF
ncbi:MAG TPA: hypothetical protein VLZ31_01635 [Microbacteriaceae bacterium]|nr:hypothetical protein [Microbacteriaceae bacterium]